MTKFLSAAGALALVLASPAFAETYRAPAGADAAWVQQVERAVRANVAASGASLGDGAVLSFKTGWDGRIEAVRVLDSTGSSFADQAVVEAVRKTRVAAPPTAYAASRIKVAFDASGLQAASR